MNKAGRSQMSSSRPLLCIARQKTNDANENEDGKSNTKFILYYSRQAGALVLLLALRIESRAHNCHYEPCHFYARKRMLHRFNFVNFSGG
jgi:hypothetical protein